MNSAQCGGESQWAQLRQKDQCIEAGDVKTFVFFFLNVLELTKWIYIMPNYSVY